MYIPKLVLLKRLIFLKVKLQDLKYFNTKSASIDEILEHYKITKAVLDIENSGQNGLTMRTFEVLGAGLRLITTNKHIIYEKLYIPNNISYTERENIILDKNFFKNDESQYILIHKYKLNSWLKRCM